MDDCTTSANSGLANFLWSTVRLLFVSEDPTDVQRIMGLTRAEILIAGVSQAVLSQESYLENSLKTLPQERAPKRAVKTNGQRGAAPDLKQLEMTVCQLMARSSLGTLMCPARCTGPDLECPVSRLARYVDRWSDPWWTRS